MDWYHQGFTDHRGVMERSISKERWAAGWGVAAVLCQEVEPSYKETWLWAQQLIY